MSTHDLEVNRGSPPDTEAGPEEALDRRAARRRLLIQAIGALLVLALAALVAWQMLSPDAGVPRRGAVEREPPLVQVEQAQAVDTAVTVTAWGRVVPSRQLALRPRVAGRVRAVGPGLEPGALLAAGETAVEIEASDYELALSRARTALVQAQAELSLEEGRQAVARREFELLDQETDTRERALMLRKPQLAAARAAVEAAETDVAEARLALERTRLAAPFDALVRSRSVALGDEVTSGTEVARLTDIGQWWVELSVPVSALHWIRLPDTGGGPGSAVRLRHEGAWTEGEARTGRVLRLLGDLDASGRMARLLVAVDDPLALQPENADRPRLLLDAFMRAEIEGRALRSVVVVEPGWLRADDTVWVMDPENRLDVRPVTVAYRDTGRVLISEGLKEGERIVTSRIATVAHGMPLRAAEDEAASGDLAVHGGAHGDA